MLDSGMVSLKKKLIGEALFGAMSKPDDCTEGAAVAFQMPECH